MPPNLPAFALFAVATSVTPGPNNIFAVLSIPSTLLWSLLGAGAGRVLRFPVQLRAFNAVMAALLVLSVLPSLAR